MAKKKGSSIILSALEENILNVLLGPEKSVYGLDILKKMNEANKHLNRPQLGVGSLYPALKRMQGQGLIEGRWGNDTNQTSGGARRRYYHITGVGKRAITDTMIFREHLRNPHKSPEKTFFPNPGEALGQ